MGDIRSRSIPAVGSLSRSQLLVYGAVAVVLLLVGARWIRSGDSSGETAGGVTYADSAKDSGSGGALAVDAEGGSDVVVDVAGAVTDPGVYRLPAGARVNDAVQRAGGSTARAEMDALNLAARLTDGQQIIIPARAESPVGVAAGSGVAGGAPTDPAAPINVGTASVEDLDTIEGIGPVTAQKILEFRDQHGGISSVDQLDQIDGIGPATMDALRSRLQP
jgi:competence protein ComEA